jgi:hypothetical protein
MIVIRIFKQCCLFELLQFIVITIRYSIHNFLNQMFKVITEF